ncbi:MAG: hypothetical protein HY334_08855 [Armatimonadetes bacterium]|nr:hypothetical protein [Armatimonadota bacterium]
MALGLSATTAAHAQNVTLGVDADSAGNTATSLGSIQNCRTLSTGDTFEVDVFITDVEALTGFEFRLRFDSKVLKVTAADDSLLLAATSGSSIVSFTEGPPGATPGVFRVAAADFGEMGSTEESGSGVLTRITFEALSKGTSSVSIGDPKLVATVGNDPAVPIGPTEEGSQTFIGPVFSANVAVGQSCTPPPSPTPHPALSGAATPEPDVTPGPGTPAAEPGQGTPGAEEGTPGAEGSIEPTPTSEATAPGGAAQEDGDGGGLSTGAWIGIGVGTAAAALAAISGGWYILRRRRGAL